MGMTMAEKVLARACGSERVEAGEYVTANVDRMMLHEGFAFCGRILEEMGVERLFDPDRVVVILDHYFPASTAKMADAHVYIRRKVKEYGIKNYFGHRGICHQVMCEQGLVTPKRLILGTDSHSTTYGALGAGGTGIGFTEMSYALATGELWMMVPPTIRFDLTGSPSSGLMAKDLALKILGDYGTEIAQYRSVEFSGPIADRMSLAGRLCMSNMGMEMGAKFAFFRADERTVEYLAARSTEAVSIFGPDPEACYEAAYQLCVDDLEPQVAEPHDPGNVKPISRIGDVRVDQALIGSCTNGRVEDLATAAKILEGRKVHPDTRLIITPASQEVMKEAVRRGYIEILVEAGAHITPSGCGACMGLHMGLLGAGEVCISSTNRNFKGRMGSENAYVYLSSPATAAASAIAGRIVDCREFRSDTTL